MIEKLKKREKKERETGMTLMADQTVKTIAKLEHEKKILQERSEKCIACIKEKVKGILEKIPV